MEENQNSQEGNHAAISTEHRIIDTPIAASFAKVETSFNTVSRDLAAIEKSVKVLNFKVDNLGTSTWLRLNEVGKKIERLTEEISKTGAVRKYDEVFKNQHEMVKN